MLMSTGGVPGIGKTQLGYGCIILFLVSCVVKTIDSHESLNILLLGFNLLLMFKYLVNVVVLKGKQYI